MNTNRYEVIAPMPYFTHLFKGDILVPKHHALAGDCWGTEDEDDVSKWITFCPDYPHLFRLLKWWEHVPVDELPKYIKWQLDDNVWVAKVERYSVEHDDTYFYAYVGDNKRADKLMLNYNDYPATESEYNEYLNKINSK